MGLLRTYPDALTADFYRYYGGSPRALHAAGVPMADIAAMAVHLPPDSAVARAIRPPQADDLWTLEAQLLALIADRLAWMLWIEQRRGGGHPPRPKPIPRPGVAPEVEKIDADTFATPVDFAEWYASQPGGRPLAIAGRAPSSEHRPTTA